MIETILCNCYTVDAGCAADGVGECERGRVCAIEDEVSGREAEYVCAGSIIGLADVDINLVPAGTVFRVRKVERFCIVDGERRESAADTSFHIVVEGEQNLCRQAFYLAFCGICCYVELCDALDDVGEFKSGSFFAVIAEGEIAGGEADYVCACFCV